MHHRCGIVLAYNCGMMKNKIDGSVCNERGAALMIALITALVVMLAATLLLTLTERMVSSHSERLIQAQVSLSEASAADGLAQLIRTAGTGAIAGGESFQLAGVDTDFTLLETGTAGIRTGFYQLSDPRGTVIIPTGSRLATVSTNGETVTVSFWGENTVNTMVEFTISTDMRPVAGTGITIDGENGAVVVLQGGGETMFLVVTPGGIASSSAAGAIAVSGGDILSAGTSASGNPLLAVTSGGSSGNLVDLETGNTTQLSSPPGTCPFVMDDGTVFGSTASGSVFSIARVRDAFQGDFNNDGIQDIAFATSYSLMVYSGASGEIHRAMPGGSLVCWGDVPGRNGISGMWSTPGGEELWLRLGYDGFAEFLPDMIYTKGWEGRFTGLGNTFAGFIDGAAVVASTSGYLQQLLEGNVFTGNADGGSIDFFRLTEDGLEAVFNPVNGDGIQLVFQARNAYRGEEHPGNTHVFSVFETQSGRRVFHTLEGDRS